MNKKTILAAASVVMIAGVLVATPIANAGTKSTTSQATKTTTSTAQTGWVKTGNTWFYYENGAKKTGWVTWNGQWYYLQTTTDARGINKRNLGAMVTGLHGVDGKMYHFNTSGAMSVGWFQLDGGQSWHYARSDGSVVVNDWQLINDKWYFFQGAPGQMTTGWLEIGGTWYYFTAEGDMVAGDRYVDGRWHRFSDSGAWLGYL